MLSSVPSVAVRFLFACSAVCLVTSSARSQNPKEFQTTGHFDPKSLSVKFAGEAKQNEAFEKPVGGGLIFRLAPNASGWPPGWEIRINADTEADSGETTSPDFVWVVTPPYRSSNPRHLDTQYGISLKDAVAWSPRDFSFVLTGKDYKSAKTALDKVLWPKTEQEQQQGLEEIARVPVGVGLLTILDSHVTEGKAEGNVGSIDWIKFTVELRLPCDFPIAKNLTADRRTCTRLR